MRDQDVQQILQALPMPVMAIGENRHVQATNAALDGLLGRGLIGRHYITALRQPMLLEAIEAAMTSRRFGKGRYLGRDGGRDTTYLVHIAPLDGRTILSFEDRTAAEAVSQLRRDFVANVSHELRTPLTALYGFIETLRGPARDDPKARDRFLEIMERETKRMTRLVGDLLQLSRVEENERQRPSEMVIVAELVRTTLAELAPVISAAGAQVNLADESRDVAVPGDPGQLRQVIGNLIENAVKYGVKGGQIDISLSARRFEPSLRQDGLELQISNGGEGIAAHHIPRLTERFYRVDAHRSREIGGTGLGLAIVKHIVNRHRGRLRIESTPGAKTTITVLLPAVLPDDPVVPA